MLEAAVEEEALKMVPPYIKQDKLVDLAEVVLVEMFLGHLMLLLMGLLILVAEAEAQVVKEPLRHILALMAVVE
jgi:hypothetical protein